MFRFSIRYFYAISNDVAIKRPGRLVKVDTQTSKVSSNLDAWKRKFIFGEGSFPEICVLRWRAGVRRTVTAQSQCTYRSLARQRKIPGCSSAPYSGQNQVWPPLPFSFSVRETSPPLPGWNQNQKQNPDVFHFLFAFQGSPSSCLDQCQSPCMGLSCPLGTSWI